MTLIREILFASNNDHKVEEIRSLMPQSYSILGLRDINWNIEVPEPFLTYEENAIAKARFVFDRTGLNCFADDSGLEIDSLSGRPGVFSARYAGEQRDHSENIQKVLSELKEIPNRKARFRSVIAYVNKQGEIHMFQGSVKGTITREPYGTGGFGYDPVFIPDGFDQTFSQLSDRIKIKISHRALAMKQFISYFLLEN